MNPPSVRSTVIASLVESALRAPAPRHVAEILTVRELVPVAMTGGVLRAISALKTLTVMRVESARMRNVRMAVALSVHAREHKCVQLIRRAVKKALNAIMMMTVLKTASARMEPVASVAWMKMTVQAPENVLLMVTVQSQTSAPWRPIVTLVACVRTTHVDPPVPTGPAMENCNATFKRASAKSPPNVPTMPSVLVIGSA